MMLVLSQVLRPEEVAILRQAAHELPFEDGRATAGRFVADIKRNEQAQAVPEREAIFAKVRMALASNPLFQSAARPRGFARLLLSRYRAGMEYGLHVDDAIMDGARTDLSFTLMLSGSGDYDGAGLVLEDRFEPRVVRLQAGDMLLYPSTTLHRVEPVTRGERLAVVGWVTSLIRSAEEREMLFDLDQSIDEIYARDGKSDLFDRLARTRSNLLRKWAET